MTKTRRKNIDAGEIRKKVRLVELTTRRFVNDVMAGEYHSVFKGRGMEFDRVREYQTGDDVRDVDWNVTARTGFPHVKLHVEERELTTMLIADASGSGFFGAGKWLKDEMATELCAVLAFSALKNNDRVGLLLFTDKIEKYIPPKKGKKHVLRIIRELIAFQPESRGTDLAGALDYVNRVLKKKSIVFLISDFLDELPKKTLAVTNRRHDLVALSITDPLELEPPPVGPVLFEDLESGETLLVDTSSSQAKKFAETAHERLDEIASVMKSLNIDYEALFTDKDYLKKLARLFKKRARRY